MPRWSNGTPWPKALCRRSSAWRPEGLPGLQEASVPGGGSDKGQLKRLRGKKFRIVRGDPVRAKVLEKAGAATAELLMAASTYDETNVAACRIAQESFGVPKLIAQASSPGVADQLSTMGVRVVQPQLALALALEGALHFPTIFDILVDTADGVEVRETRLRNPEVIGELLRNIRLPGNTRVMGLRRKGEVIVPHGDTTFRQNDLVMLMGSPDALLKAIAYLNK
jgi:Trk K+ transport system NAD-binding subunit